MSITRTEVEHIANLAALALDEEALDALTRQIGGILEYISQLESVPGAEAATVPGYPGARQSLRDDVPQRTPLAVPLKDIAPAFRNGLFLVPRLEGLGSSSDEREGEDK